MKKLAYILVIASMIAGCKKDLDTSVFERIIIGCWDVVGSTNEYYWCFNENTIVQYEIRQEVVNTHTLEYNVSSDKNNLFLFLVNEWGQRHKWTVVFYDHSSFSLENNIVIQFTKRNK